MVLTSSVVSEKEWTIFAADIYLKQTQVPWILTRLKNN